MDNKTIFVRTSTGEEQVQSRTSHLSGDVKRALSMVDGISTFGEISKRSAPSMRAGLGEVFEELEKTGLIQEKGVTGKTAKPAMPPNMVIPVKIATPRKPAAADRDTDELDFMAGQNSYAREAPAGGGRAEKSGAEKSGDSAEERLKREIETEKLRAQQEADAILRKAEEEARQRLEAAAREQREAESARAKAEQEARRVRDELEVAKLKAEQEARRRVEAAERERKEAEAARIKAEQEAIRVRNELEAAKARAEQEAKLRLEAEEKQRKEAEAARIKAEQEAQMRQAQLALRKHAEEEAERARQAAEIAAQREREAAKAKEAAAQTSHASEPAAESFSFGEFKIDEFQLPAEPQKQLEPARKAGPPNAAPAAAKQDAFSFDSFNVDETVRPAEPQKAIHPGEAAMPAQPAEAGEPVRHAIPPATSEADEVRIAREKAGRDELKRQEQERIAEEARAREMADAQAKVWAEAEQRALEAARANAEHVAYLAEHSHEVARAEKAAHPARAPRKPFAWGKLAGFFVMLGTFLLVLLVGALFIVPYFLPMRDYMPEVQKMLADELHQPVHLGYMSGRFLPTPRLDLGEIYIGDAKQFQAATAQINFDILGVFGDNKPIDSIDFQNVKVRGIALRDSAAWLQQLAVNKQYRVSSMTISQGTLDADAFQLTDVEGNLSFDQGGKFTHASFTTNSGKYSVVIDPAPGDKLTASITVRAAALPLLPSWNFDELDAKGEISSDAMVISEFNAKILEGTLQGNASIIWRSGWRAEGVLNAKKIVMRDFSKLLDGYVDGSGHFKMNSIDLAGLTDSAALDGSFVSSDGLIGGLDIVETARMRSTTNLPGGRTHYDGLRGDFTYARDVYHFTQVKIDAGVMNATANFDISNQQLSGNMKVNLSLHGQTSANLQLGGAVDSPTLVYAP